jgi:glycosyltransferase involved in cell wall biosynthesis
MHIGYVIPVFPFASETFITREVVGLRALGVQVTVFTVADVPATDVARLPPEVAALQAGNVKVDRGQMARAVATNPFSRAGRLHLKLQTASTRRSNFAARWLRASGLGRLAREAGVDALHAHWAYGTQIAAVASAQTGIPFSASVHAHEVEYDWGHLPVVLPEARFVAFCNRAAMHRLATHMPDQKVAANWRLIYHGVSLDGFKQTPMPAAAVPFRLVTIGRLTVSKGFDRLLTAIRGTLDAGVPVDLTIVGDGSQREYITKRIGELDLASSVRLAGWIRHDAVAALIAGAHAVVLLADANYNDGLPNIVLEAMSCGRPVILTPLPAAVEVIREGRGGVVLSRLDAFDEFTSAIRCWANDHDALVTAGLQAREVVVADFDERAQLKRMLAEMQAAYGRGS